jgi:cobalt-zinc-cadmium efflux system protein
MGHEHAHDHSPQHGRARGHTHGHGGGHGHDHGRGANARQLTWALILTSCFLVAEVVGGILTQSLALISDAAHMFTDAAGLAIALAAVKLGERPADAKRTFGYARFEILAAAFNAVLLFLVAIYILYEAYQRFTQPADVQSLPMLAIASLGLVVNFACMKILDAGKDESLNVKGAYLEVWADMLGSVGVILAAVAIWLTGWNWIDPLVAVAIGLWVLPRTWSLLRESLNILLQGVPEGIVIADIEHALRAVPGLAGLHSLHVWAMTSGQNVLSAHIEIGPGIADAMAFRQRVEALLHERFGIDHITIQLEDGRGHCVTEGAQANQGENH